MSAATSAPRDAERLPLVVARHIWEQLPLLLVLDVALVVAAVPAGVLILAGLYPLAALAAGITLGPVWAACVATTDRIVGDTAVSVRGFGRALVRHAGRGVLMGGLAGVVVAAGFGTLAVRAANPGHTWLLVPLFVDGTATTLLGLAGLSAFSLATTHRLRGWQLLRTSLAVVVAAPVGAAGLVALLVLIAVAGQWLPSLLVVVAAPVAVFLSAYVDATVESAPPRADAESGGGDPSST